MADVEYLQARGRVLARDRYTCRYCRFVSPPDPEGREGSYATSGWLEVHHLDDNHQNNDDGNLITVCPFCHLVHHAGNAGHREAAQVIWLPWIPQADLNLLVNCLAVASARGGEAANDAKALFNLLQAFDGPLATHFGEASTNAANLGSALMGLHRAGRALYDRRAVALDGVRMLPQPAMYAAAIRWWSAKAWRPETQWSAIFGAWQRAAA